MIRSSNSAVRCGNSAEMRPMPSPALHRHIVRTSIEWQIQDCQVNRVLVVETDLETCPYAANFQPSVFDDFLTGVVDAVLHSGASTARIVPQPVPRESAGSLAGLAKLEADLAMVRNRVATEVPFGTSSRDRSSPPLGSASEQSGDPLALLRRMVQSARSETTSE